MNMGVQRFIILASFGLACLLARAHPSFAQDGLITGPVPLQATSPDKADAGAQGRESAASRLDALFTRLKAAQSAEAATPIAAQIEQAFLKSGSDTADLLITRAKTATEAKAYDTALDLLDFIITLKPDWAEAYHRRAIVHFLMKDEDAAMRDLSTTLSREPRHFQAIAGLGAILRGMGNEKAAYKAYRRALDIHPFLEDLPETVEKMRPDFEGKPI